MGASMKITDDYKAKVRLWAANPQVVPPLPGPKFPPFRSQKFKSHAEMNAWKESMLRKLAELAPGHE